MATAIGAPGVFRLFGVGFLVLLVTVFATMIIGVVRSGANTAQLYEDEEPVTLYRSESYPRDDDGAHERKLECNYCGTRVPGNSRQCPNCGANV